MVDRNMIITETSLELLALIKYEFVQTAKVAKEADFCLEDVEDVQQSTAKLLALFQILNNDLSYSQSIELICEWINKKDLLVKAVNNLFENRTFIQFADELNSDDLKEVGQVHEDIINAMNITFGKDIIANLIDTAKEIEKRKD